MRLRWSIIAKIIMGIVFILVFLNSAYSTLDPDLGWHIRVGQTIIENKMVPRYDQFSFTMPGHPWVDHEWLVDILLAFSYSHNLWFLVIGSFSFLAFFPFLFWIFKAKRVIDLFPILFVAIMFNRLSSVRPQLISFVLFFLVFTLVFKLEREKKSLLHENYKFIFPLIFFIWANLHAGFLSGLILVFIYVSSKFIYSKIARKDYLALREDFLCLLISCLVTLLNPYGLDIYKEIFLASSNRLTLTYISEWLPVFTHIGVNLIIFNLILALFLLSLFSYFRKFSPAAIAVSLFFLLAGLRSYRMAQFFVITAMPVIFIGIENFISGFKVQLPMRKREKILVEAFTLFIFIIIFSLKTIAPNHDLSYPPKAINFLENYIKGKNEIRIFNDYAWGGYLALKLPQMKLFIDGRMPHWQDGENSAMKDYVEVEYKDGWKDVFEKRKINLVFLSKRTKREIDLSDKISGLFFLEKRNYLVNTKIFMETLKQNGWHLIYEDEVSVILEKI